MLPARPLCARLASSWNKWRTTGSMTVPLQEDALDYNSLPSDMIPERNSDPSALNELITVLHSDLHRIAARHLRTERPDRTLKTTALLHEAYLKLSDDGQRQFSDKSHFLAVASRVMRQVLVDYARPRAAKKRGSGRVEAIDSDASLPSLLVAADRSI